MKSASLKIAVAAGLFFAVAVAGAFAFIYSGVYDIAATSRHYDLTSRILRTVMEQSIKREARNVAVPELDDPEKVHRGFKSFHEMCVICHGAPGTPASQLSKGLNPKPPDLAQAAKGWSPAELYVITKRGIRMSGMPAWEPTHTGDQLWEVVAFLKVLPTMPAAEYQEAVDYYRKKGAGSSMQAGHH